GKTQAQLGQPGPAFALGIVASLVNAWVLAVLAASTGAKTLSDGVVLGVVVWLGFMATLTAAQGVFEKRPWSLWVLNNANSVIGRVGGGAAVGRVREGPAPPRVTPPGAPRITPAGPPPRGARSNASRLSAPAATITVRAAS